MIFPNKNLLIVVLTANKQCKQIASIISKINMNIKLYLKKYEIKKAKKAVIAKSTIAIFNNR